MAAVALLCLLPRTAASRTVTGFELLDPLRPRGSGPAFSPGDLAVDPLGRLYALDRGRGELTRTGDDSTWFAFSPADQGGPISGSLRVVAAGPGASVFALDSVAETLLEFDFDGHYRATIPYGPALEAGKKSAREPVDLALDKAGGALLVDAAEGGLLRFDRFGRFTGDLADARAERFVTPSSVALDRGDNVFVLDPGQARIFALSRAGTPLGDFDVSEGLRKGAGPPSRMALLGSDALAVSARDGSWLRCFSRGGDLLLHAELAPIAGRRVSDLAARGDSLLLLALPEQSEIARVRVLWSGIAGRRP